MLVYNIYNMTSGSIYKIKFPNGKHYIGLTTTSLEKRKREHKWCGKNDDTRVLYKALRKYEMVDTFELVEIDTADTIDELCEKEIRYIQDYKSYYMDGNGYNMTLGGEGFNGYVYTEEEKQKMSERGKQYHIDNPEAREKMSEIKKKYYEDNPEEREKMSEIKKKYYEETPGAREKNSEAQKQYHEDNPEAREKMSEIKKKYYEETPGAREKMSEAQKKRFENPEAREKMSEIKKKYYEDQEARRKHGKNKPFDIFKIDGTFVKTFNYQFEAREYLQKEHNITSLIKIGEVLNGNRNSSAGFVFKYQE